VVVDPLKQAVTQRYKLAPWRRADRASSRCRKPSLFSACRSKHLVVLNSEQRVKLSQLSHRAAVDGAVMTPMRRV